MRIVIDMQGAQTESRFRGIGRYTLAMAQAIVRNRDVHEIHLALSGLFPDTIDPIRTAFAGVLSQEHIHIWYAPGPVRECHPGNEWRREVAELIREAFLESLKPDVIHITSLFEGYVDDAVTSLGRFDVNTPVAVSLFDLIPLLNPKQYLAPNPKYGEYYGRKISYLGKAAVLLAISNSSREEGLRHLGIADAAIKNVSTAIDSGFRPLNLSEADAVLVRNEFKINVPFVLYAGGADERKNLSRLLDAWALLPLQLRSTHQLVFAGKMPEGDVLRLKREASAAGVRDHELIFTGYIADDVLIRLYNLCKLFVFPSWHEGFGLPALEAMACGAPVVGANTSGVPEVINFPDALFDPYDVASIAAKITQALEDDHFRCELVAHGLKQSNRFSWDECAKYAIAAMEGIFPRQSKSAGDRTTAAPTVGSTTHTLISAIAENLSSAPPIETVGLLALAESISRNTSTFKDSRDLPKVLSWRIEGPFDSTYSLALLNRETAVALAARGHDVALHSTEGPGDFAPDPNFLKGNPLIARLHMRAQFLSPEAAHVTSRNLYPPRVNDMKSRLNLLHHYAWEESGFPPAWASQFNQSLTGMTCLSRHVEKIMTDAGVRVPMSVSGCGVDHWERVAADVSYVVKAKTFRFLHVSSCFPRKGADALLEAYGSAFSANDDVTLIIKTFSNPHNEIHHWLREARNRAANFPDVLVIEGDLSDAQLKSLYQSCHVLVAPSRAEGFGLPMAEAMLSGLAVVTTNWGGQLDFCNSETSWLVDYRFVAARSHFKLFNSYWAEPDVADLAAKMKEVNSLTADERQARVSQGRRLLMADYKWADVASRLEAAARIFANAEPVAQPRIGWISTWNARCGIATYSAHLLAQMPQDIEVLAPRTDGTTERDGDHVHRCWEVGEHDPLHELNSQVALLKLDIIVVQFNYGFFNLETLSDFINAQIGAGRVVVAVLHSTSDPLHVPHKRLQSLVAAFSKCARVLVHSILDLNRLKAFGLTSNVALFSLGVIDYSPRTGAGAKNGQSLTIASYGFFLPHKGLLELIEAIVLLRAAGVDARLQMINAEYPAPESVDLVRLARRTIEDLKMQEYVTICTDYLTDSESLERLSEADVIAYPYQTTGESASAAVRFGLASGKPVVVTPLPIFDDVNGVVHVFPACDPVALASWFRSHHDHARESTPRFDEIQTQAVRWREEHCYSKVATKLHGMLTTLFYLHNHPPH